MSSAPASRLVCAGCGASPHPDTAYPFSCPNKGTADVDHVLARVLDPGSVAFPEIADAQGEGSTFERYRMLLHSYHRARSAGMSDGDFVAMVHHLDERVAAVDRGGFEPTPLRRSDFLSDSLGFTDRGGVWVKDETHNVSGSHKARHLMGVLLHLQVAEAIGLTSPSARADLAIASCGNAALAAAVVAAAGARHLRVFVPVDADPSIVRRLSELEAEVVVCRRQPGVPGDPTYSRLVEEIETGSLPFTCQGNLNGLAIEGGETLGYEIVSDVAAAGTGFDHLVVQVGGGALASSCVQAFADAVKLGAIDAPPRIHTVQTYGAHPLERAYHLVRSHLREGASEAEISDAVREAASHRSSYMWAWESEPKSIAAGILDDETYDWLAVVAGMLRTGGEPVVVSEELLADAHGLGRHAGYSADPTGTSGLAGLLKLRSGGRVGARDRVVVLFTGVER